MARFVIGQIRYVVMWIIKETGETFENRKDAKKTLGRAKFERLYKAKKIWRED